MPETQLSSAGSSRGTWTGGQRAVRREGAACAATSRLAAAGWFWGLVGLRFLLPGGRPSELPRARDELGGCARAVRSGALRFTSIKMKAMRFGCEPLPWWPYYLPVPSTRNLAAEPRRQDPSWEDHVNATSISHMIIPVKSAQTNEAADEEVGVIMQWFTPVVQSGTHGTGTFGCVLGNKPGRNFLRCM